MLPLIRNLIPYKGTILALLLMLIVQAYGDIALPQYTQDIIDTGIQNKGVEHLVPEKVTADEYGSVMRFLGGEEQSLWRKSYRKKGALYVRKHMTEEALSSLDEKLQRPIVMMYASKRMAQDPAKAKAEKARLAEIPDSAGNQTLRAMGIAYAAEAEEAAGVDVAARQNAYLWRCAIKMLLMALLLMLAASAASFFASRIGASVGRSLRSRLFDRVLGFSGAEMDHFSVSSLITRATNDIQQVQMVSTMLLRMVLYAPVLAIWGIFKVAQTGASMSWVIVLGVAVIMSLVLLLMAIVLPKFKVMQKLVDALNRVAREFLTGLLVIRAFGRESQEEERFDRANEELRRTQLFTSRVMTFMQPLMMLVMNGLIVLIIWVAAHRVDDGTMQVGTMTAFMTYSMMVVMSFMIITVMSLLLPRAGVAAERIEEVLRTETSVTAREDAVELPEGAGTLTFSHVSFRYPDAEENALTDIDFTAKAGETTAIIGSTGSGKSTLVHLIPRFFDVTEGAILLDGHDIRNLTLASLRKAVGLVPQKGILFSGTIASNIRFGKEEASMEEVRDAARIAQADAFIEEKEDGYESFIAQGGANVSGGQKQRLSIARAIAGKARLLVFDDSFSALDMKTDAALRRALAEKIAGTTKLIVAQRVGTILHADQILVLDEGQIVGRGRHAELMESCEVYRQIALSQLSRTEVEI